MEPVDLTLASPRGSRSLRPSCWISLSSSILVLAAKDSFSASWRSLGCCSMPATAASWLRGAETPRQGSVALRGGDAMLLYVSASAGAPKTCRATRGA